MRNFLHPARFISAIFFAALFFAAANLISSFYFRYIDTTEYYTVDQPVSVDRNVYKPCDTTILTTKQTALIDTHGNFYRELLLIRDDGAQYKISDGETKGIGIIKSGTKLISMGIRLPCDLPEGSYFWNVLLSYEYRGAPKNYSYITESFRVYKSGISPVTESIIKNSVK